MHRVLWSFICLIPLLGIFHRWRAFIRALRTPATLGILIGTTCLVATNWFVFIWAISHDHILHASLGYYINPLVNVVLGMLLLGERLRRLQIAAVGLAAVGVGFLTVAAGQFPWISLTLAFSFGFYGLIRKVAPVDALEGLSIETLLLVVPATGYLVFLGSRGDGAFLTMGWQTDLLLMATALVTAAPLLLFTMGARRLRLSTIGFLQYIAPSCNFLLAVLVYGEPFSTEQGITFALIWTALLIFSADAWHAYRAVQKTIH